MGIFPQSDPPPSTAAGSSAPQTWINSTFLGFDYTGTPQLKLVNKLKYEIWHQRQRHLDFRRNYQFFGLINKAEYRHPVRQIEIIPKVKNELRLEAPLLRNDPVRKENTFIFFLIARMGLLTKSDVQVGLEYTIFSQIEDPAPVGLREDFRETILALQYSNLATVTIQTNWISPPTRRRHRAWRS